MNSISKLNLKLKNNLLSFKIMIAGQARYKIIKIIAFSVISAIFADISHATNNKIDEAENRIEEKKYVQALEILQPSIVKHNSHAHYLAGIIFLSKDFSGFNAAQGIYHLQQAISQKYPPAINEMAGLYLTGENIEKNKFIALQYYQTAADMNYGPSQFNCGIMYLEGEGTEINLVKAYFYLAMASLNKRDLGDVTQSAELYRNKIAPYLSPEQKQQIFRKINSLTLPEKQKVLFDQDADMDIGK